MYGMSVKVEIGKDVSGGLFQVLAERVASLYEEYLSLMEEEKRLLDEINKVTSEATPLRGTLVYKWVKNKIGKRYWYWYLHVKEGKKTRSIYIGSSIPKSYSKGVAARSRVRELEARLRHVSRRRLEIEERVRVALNALQ